MTEDEKRALYRGVPRECIEDGKPLPFYGGMVADPADPSDNGPHGGPGSFSPIRKVMPDGSLKVVRILDPYN
jgi:hypothetical protein